MQTYMANPDKIERKWYVVDADGCTLGRLASGVASVLRGKNKPQFTPHVDTGDYIGCGNESDLCLFYFRTDSMDKGIKMTFLYIMFVVIFHITNYYLTKITLIMDNL